MPVSGRGLKAGSVRTSDLKSGLLLLLCFQEAKCMWVRCFEEPDLSSVLPSSNLGVLSDTKTKECASSWYVDLTETNSEQRIR